MTVTSPSSWQFETLGNAIVQITKNGVPVLVTDPWLFGEAYFGSWELERPLTDEQISRALASRYVWFSHGHPDHFHVPSIEKLRRDQVILLPDHYDAELARTLREMGHEPRILPQKKWVDLGDGLRVLCVANENMDAIIAIDAGGTLVLDKNDSPFCGEGPFFRQLVRRFPRSYLLALCAYDADMINTYDPDNRSLLDPPEAKKPGCVWSVGKTAEYLGCDAYACSSSQHVYARPDSAWANDYRITWSDVRRLWVSDRVALIPPFSQVDALTGVVLHTDGEVSSDPAMRVRAEAGEDWTATLDEAEWARVETFARQFRTLRAWQDFIGFEVGGQRRLFMLREGRKFNPTSKQKGIIFRVPRGSLLQTVEYGYFDDLLIGNFMQTQLFNMKLYPMFSPRVAKLGGNAKVFSPGQLWRFRWYWFCRSPVAFFRYRLRIANDHFFDPAVRRIARELGVFYFLRGIKRRVVGWPRA